MPSDSPVDENVDFGVFADIMAIYDVQPSQVAPGATVNYRGNLLGLVTTAHFKDGNGLEATSPAGTTHGGKGATSTVPTSGLTTGTSGTTWLEDNNGKCTNHLSIDFITQ